MLYKNSLKIMLSNFDIVWKTILYYAFLFLFVGVLGFFCINPVYKILEQSGFVENVINTYFNFLTNLNFTELLASLDDLIMQLASILKHNLSTVWINFAGLGFVVILVRAYLSNLTIMSSCNSLHYYMGSMNKHGFYMSFRETFGINLKAQFCYLLLNIPCDIIFWIIAFFCLKLFGISFWFTILAIVVFFTFVCCFCALKHCLFISWIPTIVVLNYGIFKALKISIKNSFRIFGRVFSNAVGLVLTLIFINFFMGIFTFSLGLIITVPISYLFVSVFGMVVTYEGQGMRYYVDVYNVITPKKKEIGDTLKAMKYIV